MLVVTDENVENLRGNMWFHIREIYKMCDGSKFIQQHDPDEQ